MKILKFLILVNIFVLCLYINLFAQEAWRVFGPVASGNEVGVNMVISFFRQAQQHR